MALLIVLSIIGSAATLVGLYILGVFISQYIVAITKMFKENVTNIIEKSRAKRAEKRPQVREDTVKEETITEEQSKEETKAEDTEKETFNEVSNDEIKVEVEDVIEEMKN